LLVFSSFSGKNCGPFICFAVMGYKKNNFKNFLKDPHFTFPMAKTRKIFDFQAFVILMRK